MNKYKDNKGNIKDNPLDLLDEANLLDDDCKLNKFYLVNEERSITKELTLEDFVNHGIKAIKPECEDISVEPNARLASSGYDARLASSGYAARLASSGNDARLASSGNAAHLVSSGNDARLASSGYAARLVSSGYDARLASSGYAAHLVSSGSFAHLVSSGYAARLASSGNAARLASSGNFAHLASSGYAARLASSGNDARLASSGNDARLASSGNDACLASSGYAARLASSGSFAHLVSSGNDARLASSGNSARLASSGNFAHLVSSGYDAQSEVTGQNSICFDCGYKGRIKAIAETIIALADFENSIPKYSITGKIGELLDFKGNTTCDKYFYTLFKNELLPTLYIDDYNMIIINEKATKDYIIYHAMYEDDYRDGRIEKIKIIGKLHEGQMYYAHCKKNNQGIEDINFKIRRETMADSDVAKYIKEKDNIINWLDYRLITGACQCGTEHWLDVHDFDKNKTFTMKEFYEKYKNDCFYGISKFVEFYEEYFK